MSKPFHLALTRFEGRADLESLDHDLIVCNVPVQFDPVELVFEVHLPASDDLVQELVHNPSSKLNLTHVALDSSSLGVRLEARSVKDLSRRNPLIEWPEFSDSTDGEAADSATRRLVLRPGESKITFTAPSLLCVEHPYRTYYNNACGDLWLPGKFTPEGLGASVHFCPNHPVKGFICSFSDSDFFTYEKRIHAALELIHGRDLPIVLKVQGSEISFYGQCQEPGAQGRPLMDAVLAAMVAMPSDRLEHERYAQIFLLMGKNADVPVEVRYLLMMTCVEAMDGKKSLQTDSTSQMLGVSLDAAGLLNAMRHQLTHGRGGYREAFQAVLSEQFRHKELDLEATFRDCITAEHQFDFAALWLRLAERLDAFWCAWLGISESLAAQRYSPVPLMLLPVPLSPVRKADSESDGMLRQIEELALKNQVLKSKNLKLNAQLKKAEKRYAQLNLQHGACEQSASENQKFDSSIE